jgi:hypothetical protein
MSELNECSQSPKDFLTIRQLAEKFPAFSEASLRSRIAQAKANGLEESIVRIGRKILINVPAFLQWINNQKSGGKG